MKKNFLAFIDAITFANLMKIVKFAKLNKKNRKRALKIGFIVLVLFLATLKLHDVQEFKVATVDVQAIVAKSSQVLALRQDQEKKLKDLQAWIGDVNTEVEKQKTQEKKDELLKKYNEEFAQKQQEIRQDYAQKLKAIDDSITRIINREAKNRGYDLVAAKGVILYGAEDITYDVSKEIQ